MLRKTRTKQAKAPWLITACFSKLCGTKKDKILHKSKIMIDKELDLQRFIEQKRMVTAGVLSLLTKHQSIVLQKLTRLILANKGQTLEGYSTPPQKDSSSDDYEKSNEYHSKKDRVDKDVLRKAAARIVNGQTRTDKRIIKLYEIDDIAEGYKPQPPEDEII